MPTPRDVLNEIKWREDALDDAVIFYRHRGAPGDVRAVPGGAVVDLGRSFFEVHDRRGGTTLLPYHRVLRIEVAGAPRWRRAGAE